MITRSTPEIDRPHEAADPIAEQIAEAALEHFCDLGIRRSSIDDLARRAGVSRMTVFRRFGSKERLVRAAIEREIDRASAEIRIIWNNADTIEQRLVDALLFAVHFLRDHPLYDRLMRSEPELLLPLLTLDGERVLQLYRSLIAGLLQTEIDRGEITPPDLDTAANVIARLALSLVLTPSSPSGDDHEQIEGIVRVGLMPMLGR